MSQLRKHLRLFHADQSNDATQVTRVEQSSITSDPGDLATTLESTHNHSPADSEPPQEVTYRSLLRNRNFRFLWMGEAISTFGSLFTRLAVPVYVYQITGSSTQLGLSVFFSLIASLVFGLFSGVLIDRWDRRKTMITLNLLNGVVLLLLVMVIAQDPPLPVQLTAIYAISFVAALLRDFFAAARVAIFPQVLSKQEYLTANALDQSTTQLAELLSYPLSITVLWLGPTLAFGLDALTFFVSASLLLMMQVSRTLPRTTQQTTILRDISVGLRTVWQINLVRKIVILSFIVPIIFSLMFTLQLLYAVNVAGSIERIGFPVLQGAMAFGFMVGALLVGRLGKRTTRGLLLAYGLAGMGVALALQGSLPYTMPWFGLPTVLEAWRPWTPLLLVAIVPVLFGGMANSLVNTGIRTIVQEQTPSIAMGRVFSVIQVASSVGFAMGALLTGFAEGRVPVVLMGLGITLVLLGLFCRFWLTNVETASISPTEAEVST